MVFSFSRSRLRASLFVALLAISMSVTVQAASLDSMQTYSQDGYTKLIMHFTGQDIDWQTNYQAKAPRLQVTLFDTENNMHRGIEYHDKGQGFLDGISLAPRGKDLAVQVDLNQPVDYTAYKLSQPSRIVFILTKGYESNEVHTVVPGIAYSLRKSLGHYGPMRSHLVAVDKNHSALITRSSRGDQRIGPEPQGLRLGLVANGDKALTLPLDVEALGRGVLSYRADKGYSITRENRYFYLRAGGLLRAIDGINRTRRTDELILYTGAQGLRTGTNAYGIEVTVSKGRVVAIRQGNSPIPPGTIVLSGHGKAMAFLQGLKVGDAVDVKENEPIAAIQSNKSRTFTGGIPLMIDGKVLYGGSPTRGGHTMLATTKDGEFIVLSLEGPDDKGEGGTTADGLSLLKSLGAWSVIELYPHREQDIQIGRFYKRQSGTGYEYVLTVL